MIAQVGAQCAAVARVDGVGAHIGEAVGLDDRACGVAADVADVNFIVARLGEQTGDQGADLSGAEDQYLVHDELLDLLCAPDPRAASGSRAQGACGRF
jgi:hypothetical protein